MDVILIPGFWLDASAWDAIVPALERAGHRTHALTLPGMESKDADRSGITLQDHINAVVATIDSIDGAVVIVGHSAGGAIAHAAVDARPNRVARVVYVDCVPAGDGDVINDGLPAEGGEIPLPDWSAFDEESLVDLDDNLRATFRERAIPVPEGVARGRQLLSDERRYEVPATVIACEFPSANYREWMDPEHPWSGYVAELSKVEEVEYIDLRTGHWPMLTKPEALGAAMVEAIGS
jgi:pimeloyl-ACP methyl ester carboxylesterase